MDAAVSEIVADRQYLQQLIASPESQGNRMQILNTLGEVDSRLELYRGAHQQQTTE